MIRLVHYVGVLQRFDFCLAACSEQPELRIAIQSLNRNRPTGDGCIRLKQTLLKMLSTTKWKLKKKQTCRTRVDGWKRNFSETLTSWQLSRTSGLDRRVTLVSVSRAFGKFRSVSRDQSRFASRPSEIYEDEAKHMKVIFNANVENLR